MSTSTPPSWNTSNLLTNTHFKLVITPFSDIWSENDGRLGMRLCEEKNEEEESNEIQTECCACEEAKYEVMFQVRDCPALWLLVRILSLIYE